MIPCSTMKRSNNLFARALTMLSRTRPAVSLMMLTLVLPFAGARAVPSFAIQTGQPCAACHVGAFGPQLTSFGRDFKLYGYISDDTKKHGIPISASDLFSFTHTQADQPPGSVSPPRIALAMMSSYTFLYWAL